MYPKQDSQPEQGGGQRIERIVLKEKLARPHTRLCSDRGHEDSRNDAQELPNADYRPTDGRC